MVMIFFCTVDFVCLQMIILYMLYPRVGPMIGLALIGTGTGGIKPCVSAFGGDQFSSEQVGLMQ